MNNFLDQLNELTNNKYDYLRLSKSELQVDIDTIYIEFMLPYDIYADETKFSDEDKKNIANACREIIPIEFNIRITYDRIQIIPQVIKRYVIDFLRKKYYMILEDRYNPNDIQIIIKNNKCKIKIPVEESIYSYCVNKQVGDKLKEYLDEKYNMENEIEFESIKFKESLDTIIKDKQIYIDDGIVELIKGYKIVGSTISSNPLYISRFKEPRDNVTICGRVVEIEKKISKGGKLFYIFNIVDPTESAMRCIYFSKGKSKSSFDCVKKDDCVIVNGSLKLDNYSTKKLVLFVENASKAEIDFEKTKKKINYVKKIKLKQTPPEPIPYKKIEEENRVYTLFEEQPYVCPLLRNNKFVVFDLETTGLSIYSDKIVEIGAVKIINGEIVNTYQTLIDPEIPMPIDASEKNNIYDNMLETAPYIQDVIVSFMDYIKDCVLVGHNIRGFDYPLLKRVMSEYGYIIDNKIIDTMELNSLVNNNNKKESLINIANKYGVTIKQAHRALDDSLGCAEIFKILANKLKLEN